MGNYGYEKNMSERQWWTDVVVSTFKNGSTNLLHSEDDLEGVASHLFENFEWDLYPNARQLLHYLKVLKGLKLCVVLNSDERLRAILGEKGLSSYFDLVLTSRGVGVEKPDARIFERVFHVGDDVVCDFDAAKKLGMKAILVDHHQSLTKSDFICHDLVDLREKIDAINDD